MLTWYQSKVKHDQTVDGKIKSVSELFLHEAVNFGEVEKHCYEQLKRRVKDPDVDAIVKAPFDYVVFYAGTDESTIIGHPFYRVDIKWADDKASYLVPAKDVDQAKERVLKEYGGSADASHVTGIKKTEILAVWHPNSELWKGDWHNRQELLLELGRKSWDINQSELFNDDGTAKADPSIDMQTIADTLGGTVTVKNAKGTTKREFKPKKNIKFFNKNGDLSDN